MSAPSSPARRNAGVTVPLFSLRSPHSWGIGEITDLPAFGAWVATAGLALVQILPLGEMSGGETSPYSALSAFGIDPLYIGIEAVPELADGAGAAALTGDDRATLERARRAHRIDYGAVRWVKRQALGRAFASFCEGELATDGPRAVAFRAFVAAEVAWLPDYALFRALKDRHGGAAWWDWPSSLARRDEATLATARSELARSILEYEWLQWLAHEQWAKARAELAGSGVAVMGDLPFMVARDSADVWSNQREFDNAVAVGVPPDAFDEDGQDWDLPAYDWSTMAAGEFAWLRRRAEYAATLYDRFRVDHLVGFYRTYSRPRDARRNERGKLVQGTFSPAVEADQLSHGERVLGAMTASASARGGSLIAEDLGTVPPFVRASLARLAVPGYKVLIWEKDGEHFRDPVAYPEVSVACFGTHDTAPVSAWWEGLAEHERRAVVELPAVAPRAAELGPRYDLAVHEALAYALAGSGSELVLFLVQELLGFRDRINVPGTVGEHNWTFRLPVDVASLARDPYVADHLRIVADALRRTGRA
ncbi:MAG: 4-alpha-glucanotransferase [Deltaproteobacteria bacterium]|nr:4-alpha-glucanotransferase [Deltaproteobacteria bacterium]